MCIRDRGSCYLPLNASILVYLYKFNNYTIPNSRYGIFYEVVLTFIFRHYLKVKGRKLSLTNESFDDLPKDVRDPFMYLCELAFQGVMKECVTFSCLNSDIDTLGLIQGVESFSRRGTMVSYNFIHLAIQELLAAYYMANQPPANQVDNFVKLLHQRQFIPVLQFYTAITKLEVPGISDAITNFVSQNTTFLSSVNNKQLLLFLLHCLYEVQESQCHLVESVVKQLTIGLNFGRWSSAVILTPVDCLYIGHFLSHVCTCLLYTSPSPRDATLSRMPSSA